MNNILDRVNNIINVDTTNIQLPKSLKLELASVCNHKCSYCVVPLLKTSESFMSEKIFHKSVQEAHRLKIKEIGLFHMGEGTLHPQFNDYVDYIRNNYSDIDVFITTNGTQLDKLKYCIKQSIKSIKVSLNGYNKQSHLQLTGKDTFDLIIDNIKQLIDYRNSIKSSTQISASSIFYNCPEQNDFADNISKLVDCYYYTQIFNQANKIDNKYIQLTDDAKILKHNMDKPCFGLFNLCHIKSNGDINICRFGVDNEFTIGNILNNSLDDAWFSDKANDLRRKHLNDEIITCNKCVGIKDGI